MSQKTQETRKEQQQRATQVTEPIAIFPGAVCIECPRKLSKLRILSGLSPDAGADQQHIAPNNLSLPGTYI